MKQEILNLFKLKSIVTLLMVSSLITGWFLEKVTNEQFIPLVTMILTFYFAKQSKTT